MQGEPSGIQLLIDGQLIDLPEFGLVGFDYDQWINQITYYSEVTGDSQLTDTSRFENHVLR